MRIGRFVSAAIATAATTALVAIGAPVYASEPEDHPTAVERTYQDDAGTIHYQFDPASRPGAKVSVEHGQTLAETSRTTSECSFVARGDGVGESGSVTIVDELSFDPATCVRTVSIATYPADEIPAEVTEELAPQQGSTYDTTVEGAGASLLGTRAVQASWTQKLSAWVGDPVGIHVTETKITRTWSSTGTWNNKYEWGWYTPSGWSRTSQGQTGTATTGDTRGTFQNSAFGAVNEYTYTNHSRTMITTSSSGAWDWSYVMNKSGEGANDLLSYHYALG